MKKFFNNIQFQYERKITSTQITILLRQIANLIAGGIPIIRVLEILQTNEEQKQMRVLLYRLKARITSGLSIAACFAKHPQYFDAITCHLTSIGEKTGKLELMLQTIVNIKEVEFKNKQRMRQILFYPSITIILASMMSIGLLCFIVPKFAAFFYEAHVEIPPATKVLFNVSTLMQKYIMWFLLALVFLIFIYKAKFNKNHLYKIAKHVPIIKIIIHKNILVAFANTLAIVLSAGIPIIEGLNMINEMHKNTFVYPLIANVQAKTLSGLQLNIAMNDTPFFPNLMLQMIRTGEESGKLPEMLSKIAELYADEVQHLHSYLIKTLEPLIMLILGVLIGGLVLLLYLPIFSLGSAF